MAGLLLPQGGQAAVGILTRLSVLLLAHGGPGTTTCSAMMIPSSRSRLRASPRWPRDREAMSQHPGASAASAAQNAPFCTVGATGRSAAGTAPNGGDARRI